MPRIKPVTNKQEEIPEELFDSYSIWDLLNSDLDMIKIMEFKRPLIVLFSKNLQYKRIYQSGWSNKQWNLFKDWREKQDSDLLKKINGKNIELWLREYTGHENLFLLEVSVGMEAAAGARIFEYVFF